MTQPLVAGGLLRCMQCTCGDRAVVLTGRCAGQLTKSGLEPIGRRWKEEAAVVRPDTGAGGAPLGPQTGTSVSLWNASRGGGSVMLLVQRCADLLRRGRASCPTPAAAQWQTSGISPPANLCMEGVGDSSKMEIMSRMSTWSSI
jgi:hypothetical protein